MAVLTDKQAAYLECMRRGHEENGVQVCTSPPYEVCKHCGTTFQREVVTHEALTPFGWKHDIEKAPGSVGYMVVIERKRPEGWERP